MEGIASGNFQSEDDLIGPLQIVKSGNFLYFSVVLLLVMAGFTFLITRLTLRPSKNAMESQKRLISDIAHELRTPLAIIKTNNEVLLMDQNINPEIKSKLKENTEDIDRMSEIINNTLSFNSLLRPERIKFDNVDLGKVVDSSVKGLRRLAEKKHLEITMKKIPPNIVWGNAVALEQIATNLLKNAINYTPKGGAVTIRISPDYYGSVILTVEDTGIGISKYDLMRIFEPFYRTERSRSRGSGSSGLGLTIVSELVKIHSGVLTIKSLENEGTIAVVALPYGKNLKDEESLINISELSEISINSLKGKNMRGKI